MAGGKGRRMNISGEKLLLKYDKPIISYVIDAIRQSDCFSRIIASTSIHSKQTRKLLQESNIEVLDTPGNDYVLDLNLILKSLDDHIFITSGDMPLLDKQIITKIINLYNISSIWTSYLVTENFMKSTNQNSYFINLDNKKCFFTGLSIVDARKVKNLKYIKENYIILNDKRISTNINTYEDYQSLLPTTFP